MPAEILNRPNPPPGKSQLPDSILDLEVTLDTANSLTNEEKNAIQKFRRMANYIAAAMIFLKDNVLLERTFGLRISSRGFWVIGGLVRG
jgi:xylulose-5-phosphate/fructose-6-phosphate phosphoketolase